MGKVKKLRQKYHNLVKVKKEKVKIKTPGLRYEEVVSGDFDKVNIATNPVKSSDSNIFSGIKINVDNLNTLEDDRASVRSIAKSVKYDANGKLLKKDEIRKLRHEHFMQRLDFVHKMRNDANKKNKKRKKNKKPLSEVNKINHKIPDLVKIEEKKTTRPVRKRGVEKAKKRQKNMLEDMSAFKKILEDPNFTTNPYKCIADSVRKRLLEDVNKL